tara:strand:+ start:2754 stop:4205 length:1452 start_codon:yes stop_codon:yes gene_type:complete
MALVKEQEPLYNVMPVGQPIIFTVFDSAVISGSNHKIKYIAEVYVDTDNSNVMVTANRVAILKATPNLSGYGMFDFSTILDSYVTPDYTGGEVADYATGNFSQYKGNNYSDINPHSIHQIDKFSTNRNAVRYFKVKFKIEYATTATGTVSEAGYTVESDKIVIFNGVLYDNDIFVQSANGFGYPLNQYGYYANNNGTKGVLSNAPQTQYIRENDFATLAFFNQISFAESGESPVAATGNVDTIGDVHITFYNSSNVALSTINLENIATNGGSGVTFHSHAAAKIGYVGIGTANIENAGGTIPANWHYYTVELRTDTNIVITSEWRFYKQTDDCKGFETIRLTWLNKWGFWDYYNFTKKSIRNFNTERKAYKQVSGTWGGSKYLISDHTGGMKNYSSTIKETITLNTDYITEAEALWLEELFISNDVYILSQNSSDTTYGYIRKYITPCRLTTTDLIRKTTANDKLIQYTFDIETDRTKKAQKI